MNKIIVCLFLALSTTSIFAKSTWIDLPKTVGEFAYQSQDSMGRNLAVKIDWQCIYFISVLNERSDSCGNHSLLLDVDLNSMSFNIPRLKKKFSSPTVIRPPFLYMTVSIIDKDTGEKLATNIDHKLLENDELADQTKYLKKIIFHKFSEKKISWKLLNYESLDSIFKRFDEIIINLGIYTPGMRHFEYRHVLARGNITLPNLPEVNIITVCGDKCQNHFKMEESITLHNKGHHYRKNYARNFKVPMTPAWPEEWKDLEINNDDTFERDLEHFNREVVSSGWIEIDPDQGPRTKWLVPEIEFQCSKGFITGSLKIEEVDKIHDVPLTGTCGDLYSTIYFKIPFAVGEIPLGGLLSADLHRELPESTWVHYKGKGTGYIWVR